MRSEISQCWLKYDKSLRFQTRGQQGVIEALQRDRTDNQTLSQIWLHTNNEPEIREYLFTDNTTDNFLSFGKMNESGLYFKNGINNYLLRKYKERKEDCDRFVNPERRGTKAAIHYELTLNPGESKTICLRLSGADTAAAFGDFDIVFKTRIAEADEFYNAISPCNRNGSAAEKELYTIQRQAFAGMLWNKQLYYLVVDEWLRGDVPKQPQPSPEHQNDGASSKAKTLDDYLPKIFEDSELHENSARTIWPMQLVFHCHRLKFWKLAKAIPG
ncbi:MAG: hypothetical protein JW795_15875 [Chitinivibrionales bacterium]|nr:hypothetical protein [Chitinivibrionales bacterium]